MTDVAILLYDGVTALDAVGPAQVLATLPSTRLLWTAAEPGPKRTDCGVALVAEVGLADAPAPDVILVPGAVDVRPASRDARVIAWLRAAHGTSRWTTSVCTGAIVLAHAGILHNLEATTHWAALEQLRKLGAVPVPERVVRRGKVITAAGVSAGIDMALQLAELIAGETAAQAVQLAIEYDPAPPFDTGSVAKAPPGLVAEALRALAGTARPQA